MQTKTSVMKPILEVTEQDKEAKLLKSQVGWGLSLCPDAAGWSTWAECDPFLLQGPRLFPDYRREKLRAGKPRGVCGAIEVSGDEHSADLSRGRQRATRPSVPLNVLENSLTLRSVALHLPIVASPGSSQNRDSFERGCWDFGKSGFSHPKNNAVISVKSWTELWQEKDNPLQWKL